MPTPSLVVATSSSFNLLRSPAPCLVSPLAILPTSLAEEQYAHPWVCLFTVLFKFSALALYILCSIFIQSFVIEFVVTVFLIALDFWTVKNVSGWILVGLRWWNEVDEQGQSVWHFESVDQHVCHSTYAILLVDYFAFPPIGSPLGFHGDQLLSVCSSRISSLQHNSFEE